MNRRLMEMAEKYIIQRKRRMQLLRAVTAMALVVAICTSYVLILPGLTLAAEVYCGQEEHVHTADCYVDTLSCLIEPREATTVVTEVANCSFVPHQHTADCRNAADELCCGYWDKYIHVHDEMCYDNSGAFICTLKETPMHNHNDGCYTWVDAIACGLEENAGHAHGEGCYTRAAEPTCGLEENVGHHHDENCTVVTKNLTCDVPATQTDITHEHTDECYEIVTTYTCDLTEGEGAHAHTLDCYPMSAEPTCGLNEGDGAHTHTEECNAKVRDELTCTKYPEKVHTHSAACVDQTTGYYTCGYVEVLKHQHTQDCVKTVVAEDAGHQHTAACYTTTCVCEIPEHIHNDDCFIEKSEGEETAEPTPEVTPEATIAPTEEVTAEPTVAPTEEVTAEPTVAPTEEVTEEPTVEPTEEVTEEPTAEPTVEVTAEPTVEPTPEVTEEVTEEPTVEPTPEVTEAPTAEPTVQPTATPEGTDYTEEEWEYINAILNGTAPEGMGDIGFFGLDDPAVYAEPGGQDCQDLQFGEGCPKIENVFYDTESKSYKYALEAQFSISAWYVLQYGANSKFSTSINGFNLPPNEQNTTINGTTTDENYNNQYKTPPFYVKYNNTNPDDPKLEIWFSDDYIQYVRENYCSSEKYQPGNLHSGSFAMQGELTGADIKDEDKDKSSVTITVAGKDLTINRDTKDDSGQSMTNKFTVSKWNGNFDWKSGTLSYGMEVKSQTGTNGNTIAITDKLTMNPANAFTIDKLNVLKVNGQPGLAKESSEDVKLEGCSCGLSGVHVHYQVDESGTITNYKVPPMAKDEIIKIEYEYLIDKSTFNDTKGNLNVQTRNAIEAVSGTQGTWDYNKQPSNSIDSWLQTDKLSKSVTVGKGDEKGYAYWTLTVNKNYLDIAGKTLTDTMLGQLVTEDGKNLIFGKQDEQGYVSSIEAEKTDGTKITIDENNYKDYFDIVTDENGKVSLTFKDEAKDSKFTIQYATYHKPTNAEQTIVNDAEFEGDSANATAKIPESESFGVEKTCKTEPMQTNAKPNSEGTYTLEWNTKYKFPTDGKIKLRFGDELSYQYNTINAEAHYFTQAQMQSILNNLQPLMQMHSSANVNYKITLLYKNQWGNNVECEYVEGDTLEQDKYYGFSFETDSNSDGILLPSESGEDYVFDVTYQSTMLLQEEHAALKAANKAFNATKEDTAEYDIPRTVGEAKIKKEYIGQHTITDLSATSEIQWMITITNGGSEHEQIDLTDTLPQYFKVTKVMYGWDRYNGVTCEYKDGEFILGQNQERNDDGWLHDKYNQNTTWVKLGVTTDDNFNQTLSISLKGEKNSGEEFWNGNSNAQKVIVISCQIDPEALPNTYCDNGTYQFEYIKNSVSGKVDGKLDVSADAPEVDLEYTDKSKVYRDLAKYQMEFHNNSNYAPTMKYRVEINAEGKDLLPGAPNLTLTDEMRYEPVGSFWDNTTSKTYGYMRNLTLDVRSIKVYKALTDENGKPVLDKNGNLQADTPINDWKANVTYVSDGTQPYGGDYWAEPLNTPKNFEKTKVITTVTVPDGMALILEYEPKMTLTVPTGAEYTMSNLENWAKRNNGNLNTSLSNSATLTGTDTNEVKTGEWSESIKFVSTGFISTAYGLTIKKYDEDQNNIFLPGTKFMLYQWTGNGFGNGKEMETNANGELKFNYSTSSGTQDLRPNTAYYLVETEAVEPYILPAEADRPLIVFHVWSSDEDHTLYPDSYPNNMSREEFKAASVETLAAIFSGIEGKTQGVYTIDGSAEIEINMTNRRERRDLEVKKEWVLGDNTSRPNEVYITLRRYAVPENVYNNVTGNLQGGYEVVEEAQWEIFRQYPDNSFSQTATLSESAGLSTKWTDLEANGADANGNKLYYVYYVVENGSNNDAVFNEFIPSYSYTGSLTDQNGDLGITVTNTRKQNVQRSAEISIRKYWQTGTVRKNVEVHLIQQKWVWVWDAESGTTGSWQQKDAPIVFRTATLGETNAWFYFFNNAPLYQIVDENGQKSATAYTYWIEEITDEFVVEITTGMRNDPAQYFDPEAEEPLTPYAADSSIWNDLKLDVNEPNAEATFFLTNSLLDTFNLDLSKEWHKGNASATWPANVESLVFTLTPYYKVTTEEGGETYEPVPDASAITKTLTSTANPSKVTFENLPKKVKVNGQWVDCYYKLTESTPDSETQEWTVSYEGTLSADSDIVAPGTDEVTVTNSLPDTFKLIVNKYWNYVVNGNSQSVNWPNDVTTVEITVTQAGYIKDDEKKPFTKADDVTPVVRSQTITSQLAEFKAEFDDLPKMVKIGETWYPCYYQITEVVKVGSGENIAVDNTWTARYTALDEKYDSVSSDGVFTLPQSWMKQFYVKLDNERPVEFKLQVVKSWQNVDNQRLHIWPNGAKVTFTLTREKQIEQSEWENDETFEQKRTLPAEGENKVSQIVSFEGLPKQWQADDGSFHDYRYKLTESTTGITVPCQVMFTGQVDANGYITLPERLWDGENVEVTVTNTIPDQFYLNLRKNWLQNGVPMDKWPVSTVEFSLTREYKQTNENGATEWKEDVNYQQTLRVGNVNGLYPDASVENLPKKVLVDGQWVECRYRLQETTTPSGEGGAYWTVEYKQGDKSIQLDADGSIIVPNLDVGNTVLITANNVLPPDTFDLSLEKIWRQWSGSDSTLDWPDGLEITLTLTQQYNTNTGVQNPETGEPLEADWVTNTKDGVPVTWTLTLDESASSKRIDGLPKQVYINGKLCDCRYILTENEGQVTGGTQWELSVSGSNGNAIESCVRSGQSYVLTPNANTGTSSSLVLTNTIKFFAGKIELDITKEWSGVEEENIPNTLELRFFYRNAKFDASTEPKKWILEENEGYDSLTLTKDANGKWQGTLNEDIFNLAYGEDNNPTAGSYLKVYTGVIKEFDEQGNELTGFMPIYTLPSGMPTSLDDYLENEKSYTLKPGFLNNYKLTEFPKDNAPSEYYYLLSLTKPTAEGASDKSLTITNTPDKFTITKKWDSNFRGGEVLDMYLYLEYVEDDATGNNVTYQPVIESADSPAPKVSFTDVKGQTKTLLQGKNDELVSELFVENGKVYVHIKRKVETPPEEGPIEWKITFSGLPKNAKYRVTEMEGKGYTVAYSGSNNGLFVDVGDTSGNATITNTPTSIKVVKQFVTVDAPKTPINVPVTTLYFTVMRQKYEADGETKIGTLETYMDISTAQLKATAQNTTVSVNDDKVVCLQIEADAITSAGFELSYLPKYWYDASNQTNGLWKYTVQEVTPVGNAYQPVHAALDKSDVNPETSIAGDNTITVTNVVTDINVTKVWLAVDGNTLNPANLPDITLTLMQSKYNAPLNDKEAHKDDVVIGTVTLSYDTDKVVAKNVNNGTAIGTVGQQTQTADKNIYWSYKWSNLPAYQQDGEPYYYYVKETNPGAGWTQATDATANTQNPIAGNATSNREFQITNEAIRYTLPETGGMGTLPYTAGGLLLMAAAAFLLGQQVKHRREDC